MISWIKIEQLSTLPTEEVIALRENDGQMAIGFLGMDDGALVCDEEYSVLDLPTHYILKEDILKIL